MAGELGEPEVLDARGALEAERRAAALVARVLDAYYLDPVLGLLLPGLGDVVSSALGVYIVNLARRRGLPRVVIARMLANLAVDALVGSVPLVGDLADVFIRANQRNLALLEARHPHAGATPGDWLLVAGAALLFAAAVAAPMALLVWAATRLF